MDKDVDVTETEEVIENEQDETESDGGTDQEIDSEEESESPPKVKKSKEPPKDEEKVVPLAALKEARYHLKQERQQAKALKEQYEKAEARLQEFLKKFETQQVPDFSQDPGGHLLTKQQLLEKQIEAIKSSNAEQQKQARELQERESFVSRYRMAASEYAAEKPDFKDAYNFLISKRAEELKAAGYPEEKIIARMHQDEMAIVNDSFEEDINPASRIYAMAVARGYAGNKVQEENQKLETLQRGLKSGKTLSKGGSPSKGLTLEALANMSDDEFSQVDQKVVERILRGQTIQ